MQESSGGQKVETLLIAGVLIPPLLRLVMGHNAEDFWFFVVSCVSLMMLMGYYIYTHLSNKYIFTLLLFLAAIGWDAYVGSVNTSESLRVAIRSLFGCWFLITTIREIIRLKSFEMLVFMAALFLGLNAVLYFPFLGEENMKLLVLFGSTFTLATVVYYENLWERYTDVTKKWILVCLLSLLVDVLLLSKNVL